MRPDGRPRCERVFRAAADVGRAGRRCCRTTAGSACWSGGPAAAWSRWRRGGRSGRFATHLVGFRDVDRPRPTAGWSIATCAASPPAWTSIWRLVPGDERHRSDNRSRVGRSRAGRCVRRPAADWVIGPVFIHGIASRTLAGIRRVVERDAVERAHELNAARGGHRHRRDHAHRHSASRGSGTASCRRTSAVRGITRFDPSPFQLPHGGGGGRLLRHRSHGGAPGAAARPLLPVQHRRHPHGAGRRRPRPGPRGP